ncbi:MAG TPA: C45 family autoproteolytic acyltransferase/hydrolase [bacterium]|nr:C45 family autoproteolytic acyltransferase/hydrolase [bacterium]
MLKSLRVSSILLIMALTLTACGSKFHSPAALPITANRTIVSPDGTATLTWIGGARVLKLSGSHRQMGYNHGYLLAPEIMNMLNIYGAFVLTEFKQDYDALLALQPRFDWGEYGDELTGMLAGLRDALGAEQLLVTLPGRKPHEVTLADLQLMNTMGDWLIGSFACSSLSVWGKNRADGSTLLARNFDWMTDPAHMIMDHQLIIAYAPDDAPRWINVTFVGDIGCISGINEHGACAVIHVSLNEVHATTDDGLVPGTLALRRVLEKMGPTGVPADADAMLDAMPQMGQYLYHLAFPAAGRADDEVAGVLEYNGDGAHADGRATHRRPSDNLTASRNPLVNQRLARTDTLLNANHYLKRERSIPLLYSSGQYMGMKRALYAAAKDDNVEVMEALNAMADVGFTPSFIIGPWITLHTVVFEPQQMRLHVFQARDGQPGYDSPRVGFPFTELFK